MLRTVEHTENGALLLHVRGISELVRDTDAAFFTDLGTDLQLISKVIMALSDLMIENWGWWLVGWPGTSWRPEGTG